MQETHETLVYCIQCKDIQSGKEGTFMYSNNAPFVAISPVFADLVGLYSWLRANGYQTVSGDVSDLRVYKVQA